MSEDEEKKADPLLGDLRTIGSLAATLGMNVVETFGVLTAAGVPVVGGVFAASALLRALGAAAGSVTIPSKPNEAAAQSVEVVLRRALSGVGLHASDFVQRRGLRATLTPARPETQAFYSVLSLDSRDERPFVPREGDIEISSAHPRSLRVYTTKQAHGGVGYFTVADPKALDVELVVFLELERARGWMIPTAQLVAHVDRVVQLPHAHIHNTTGALRLGFPNKRSTFDLGNRIALLGGRAGVADWYEQQSSPANGLAGALAGLAGVAAAPFVGAAVSAAALGAARSRLTGAAMSSADLAALGGGSLAAEVTDATAPTVQTRAVKYPAEKRESKKPSKTRKRTSE